MRFICPKLDTTLKLKLPKQPKDADNLMVKTKALLLDAVGPLVCILDHPGRLKVVTEVVTQSLKFLGNALAMISYECRKQAGSFCNKDSKCLIEDEERFKDAALLLLVSAKIYAELVKALNTLSN